MLLGEEEGTLWSRTPSWGEIEEGNARATGFLGGGDGEEECSEGMLLLLLLLRCVSGAGK